MCFLVEWQEHVGPEGHSYDYKWQAEVASLCGTPAEGRVMLDTYKSSSPLASEDKTKQMISSWAGYGTSSIR